MRKLNIADHTYIIESFFDREDFVILLSDITDVKKMAEDLSQQFTHLLRFKMSMQYIIDGNIIESRHLPQYLLDASTCPSGASRTLDDMMADYAFKTVMDSLEQHKGNKALAELSLGISRAKLYRIIAGRKKPACR